jgi:hypothetical protein
VRIQLRCFVAVLQVSQEGERRGDRQLRAKFRSKLYRRCEKGGGNRFVRYMQKLIGRYDWRLSNTSPHWYEWHDDRIPPPFCVKFVTAGPRLDAAGRNVPSPKRVRVPTTCLQFYRTL